MAGPPTPEQVFDAAIRMQIRKRRSLEVTFSPGRVQVNLPPKRLLAVACAVPVSQITNVLSTMEENQLIGTEQRGGMWTTPVGNRFVAVLLAGKYRDEAEALLGPAVLQAILVRL